MRLLIILLSLLSIFLVFYLSWIPDSRMGHLWFLPKWLANWADAEDNLDLRTGVPFVVLGLLVGLWLEASRVTRYGWGIACISLMGLVILAEVGQLAIAGRNFSWMDVMWGCLGAIVGLTLSLVFKVTKLIKA
ncbi:VanZ family protein [Tellurirhabdus bombi]|uniref:VanZ family protein n=1 Tax=Tellurirhabdus bombi TaxID=2907205 RepID=UPI001F26B9DD|nr:VanZ family protein [Tellurirhabdus bombi]